MDFQKGTYGVYHIPVPFSVEHVHQWACASMAWVWDKLANSVTAFQ